MHTSDIYKRKEACIRFIIYDLVSGGMLWSSVQTLITVSYISSEVSVLKKKGDEIDLKFIISYTHGLLYMYSEYDWIDRNISFYLVCDTTL